MSDGIAFWLTFRFIIALLLTFTVLRHIIYGNIAIDALVYGGNGSKGKMIVVILTSGSSTRGN